LGYLQRSLALCLPLASALDNERFALLAARDFSPVVCPHDEFQNAHQGAKFTMTNTDWSGRKYLVIKEMGESIDIIFGRVSGANTDWYLRPHNISDGVSAFSELIKRDQVFVEHPPQMKDIARPRLVRRLWLMLRYLWSAREIHYQWKKGYRLQRRESDGVISLFFSKDDTDRMLACAKKQNVSLTSLLLAKLDEVCLSDLLKGQELRAWLMPVNLRGGVQGSAEI